MIKATRITIETLEKEDLIRITSGDGDPDIDEWSISTTRDIENVFREVIEVVAGMLLDEEGKNILIARRLFND